MTQRFRDQLTGAVLSIAAALILSIATGLETKRAHDADITRILDVLCEMKPQARACADQRKP